MRNTFIRAVASGALLVGLGMLGLGCNNSTSPPPHGITGDDTSSLPDSAFEKVETPPVNADTHFAAGQLAESRGDSNTAIDQYRLALKQNPKHLATLYRLAVVQTQIKQYPQAIATWKTYVAATGSAASAYGNLGFCYEVAGQVNEAEAAYLRGISRDPKDQTCRVNYGLMLAAEARSKEALDQFQAVLTPAESHYNLGSVFEQQGHREMAKVEYRKAVELDPNLMDAQKRLEALK